MNTVVEQAVYTQESEQVYKMACNKIKSLENKMSFFIPTSDVSKINQNAGRAAVMVSAKVIQLISLSIDYSEITLGAFDITLAPIIALWRDGGQKDKLPSDEEIGKILQTVNFRNIEVMSDTGKISLTQENSMINLGAIAKGFAADECIKLYQAMGVESALINFGGNVKTMGTKPDDDDWVVGIQDPDQPRGACKEFCVNA